MKCLKRVLALMLAVMMFTVTPAADYIGARKEAQAFAPALVLAPVADYVLSLAVTVVGCYMSYEMVSNLASKLGGWVKNNSHYQDVYNGLINAKDWTYAAVSGNVQDVVNMVKDFLKEQNGYGTDEGMEFINYDVYDFAFNNSVTYRNGVDIYQLSGSDALTSSDYIWTFSSNNNPQGLDLYAKVNSYDRIGCFINSGASYDSINFKTSLDGVILSGKYAYVSVSNKINYWSLSSLYSTIELSQRVSSGVFDDCPFPVFSNGTALNNYLKSGVIDMDSLLNDYVGTDEEPIPVVSVPDIQGRDVTIGDILSTPVTQEEAVSLLELIKQASTAKDMENALAPTLTVIYGGKSDDPDPEEPNDKIPWLPDITSLFNKLGNSVDSVKNYVKGIPGALSDILTAIKAVPGNIQVILDEVSGKILERFVPLINGVQSLVSYASGIPQHLTDILNGIKALPGQIADSFSGFFNPDGGSDDEGETDPEKWKVTSDISKKFPFCIPFDLFECIKLFSEASIKPRWEIPFVVASIGIHESIVFDLSTQEWQPLVMVVRITTLIGYCLGLIVLTRGLIKG